MKKTSQVLLLIFLAVLLVGCGVKQGGIDIGGYTYDGNYTAGGGRIAGRVNSIDISWIEGQVTIVYHDGADIILSETASAKMAEDEELRWQLDGTTLRIKYAASGFRSMKNLDKQLTVRLPESFRAENVDISVVSADVQLEKLLADAVELESVSGGINAAQVQTDRLAVSTVSGDAVLRLSRVPDSISINTVSGDAELYLPENAGITVKVDSVSGRVSGNLPMENRGKGQYVSGNGQCDVRVDTVSGDVRFDVND